MCNFGLTRAPAERTTPYAHVACGLAFDTSPCSCNCASQSTPSVAETSGAVAFDLLRRNSSADGFLRRWRHLCCPPMPPSRRTRPTPRSRSRSILPRCSWPPPPSSAQLFEKVRFIYWCGSSVESMQHASHVAFHPTLEASVKSVLQMSTARVDRRFQQYRQTSSQYSNST